MVRQIVLVAVHGPEQINLYAMGMAVVFDHLKMILHGIDKLWRMGGRWNSRPDTQANAYQPRQEPLPD